MSKVSDAASAHAENVVWDSYRVDGQTLVGAEQAHREVRAAFEAGAKFQRGLARMTSED